MLEEKIVRITFQFTACFSILFFFFIDSLSVKLLGVLFEETFPPQKELELSIDSLLYLFK